MNVLLGYFSIRPITIQFKFRCTSNNHPPSIQTARHYTRRDAEQAPTQLEFHRLSPLAHFVSFPLPPASEYKGEYFGMHFNLLLILTPCLSFSPLSIHPSTSPADLYMFILALLPVSVNVRQRGFRFLFSAVPFCLRLHRTISTIHVVDYNKNRIRTFITTSVPLKQHQ